MKFSRIFAVCGAVVGFALVATGVAMAAGGTSVTVRVEGRSSTLLAPKVVSVHSGSLTRFGAPKGSCPAASAAGALDTATDHRWTGTFSTSFNDYFIQSILGDTETSTSFYWGIWIDNKYATTGACEIKLHRGDRVLFAVDSVAHHEHPIGLSAPGHVTAGRSFAVKAVWFTDGGVKHPLAGAHITAAGVNATTDRNGIAHITAHHAGTLALKGTLSGYIRSAPVTVRVAG
jgi:hypothetical protein